MLSVKYLRLLQTAANPRFQQSLLHNCCLEDDSLEKPNMPPYYNQCFFNIINKVKENTPLNPVHMNVKQWYNYLLEEEVTMEVVDNEGRQQARKCRVELLMPNNDWSKSFYLSRMRGLTTETRSFNFKLLHQLLPCNERLNRILPNNHPNCTLCTTNQIESPVHAFFSCDRNSQAAQYLVHLTRPYDSTITEDKILLFDISTTDPIYELPALLVLATGLSFIWLNRVNKKRTTLYQIRAELECLVSLLRKSWSRNLKEA
jgi:hypothetical protein